MVVTRTGWPLEYIDDQCLYRVIELLEYWRREAQWQEEAITKAQGRAKSREPEIDVPEYRPLTEEETVMQFNRMPRASTIAPGMDQSIERIPPEMRAMIDWAEGVKKDHKIN